ncbi:hypothetical protein B0H66DRAFT_611052 [Apodospora peruviana]|uniref:Secreted protein n=1 Tax=Apodospora peruviana TaxID=516989 RepID=A0AAE0IRS0_9PEZI|nr:hypothetical protein B0H66DRAFT_611052 [Apodospora peruviana]
MRVFPFLLIPLWQWQEQSASASPLTTSFSALLAEDLPSASQILITSASTSGSGCPRHAVFVTISDDRTVVTLGFYEFQTYFDGGRGRGKDGRGRSQTDRDKNCDIRLNMFYPAGYTFAVMDVTYHGFAQLDSGVSGSFTSTYEFNSGNGGKSCTTQANITGGGAYESGTVYTKSDVVPVVSRVKAPCGRNATLLIRTRVNLSEQTGNASATGTLTGDDATFALEQQVHIGWTKECNV